MQGRRLFASSAIGQMSGDFVTKVSDSVPWRVMVSPSPHDQPDVTNAAYIKGESKCFAAAQIRQTRLWLSSLVRRALLDWLVLACSRRRPGNAMGTAHWQAC